MSRPGVQTEEESENLSDNEFLKLLQRPGKFGRKALEGHRIQDTFESIPERKGTLCVPTARSLPAVSKIKMPFINSHILLASLRGQQVQKAGWCFSPPSLWDYLPRYRQAESKVCEVYLISPEGVGRWHAGLVQWAFRYILHKYCTHGYSESRGLDDTTATASYSDEAAGDPEDKQEIPPEGGDQLKLTRSRTMARAGLAGECACQRALLSFLAPVPKFAGLTHSFLAVCVPPTHLIDRHLSKLIQARPKPACLPSGREQPFGGAEAKGEAGEVEKQVSDRSHSTARPPLAGLTSTGSGASKSSAVPSTVESSTGSSSSSGGPEEESIRIPVKHGGVVVGSAHLPTTCEPPPVTPPATTTTTTTSPTTHTTHTSPLSPQEYRSPSTAGSVDLENSPPGGVLSPPDPRDLHSPEDTLSPQQQTPPPVLIDRPPQPSGSDSLVHVPRTPLISEDFRHSYLPIPPVPVRMSKLVFEEMFYTSSFDKLNLWCVNVPLHGSLESGVSLKKRYGPMLTAASFADLLTDSAPAPAEKSKLTPDERKQLVQQQKRVRAASQRLDDYFYAQRRLSERFSSKYGRLSVGRDQNQRYLVWFQRFVRQVTGFTRRFVEGVRQYEHYLQNPSSYQHPLTDNGESPGPFSPDASTWSAGHHEAHNHHLYRKLLSDSKGDGTRGGRGRGGRVGARMPMMHNPVSLEQYSLMDHFQYLRNMLPASKANALLFKHPALDYYVAAFSREIRPYLLRGVIAPVVSSIWILVEVMAQSCRNVVARRKLSRWGSEERCRLRLSLHSHVMSVVGKQVFEALAQLTQGEDRILEEALLKYRDLSLEQCGVRAEVAQHTSLSDCSVALQAIESLSTPLERLGHLKHVHGLVMKSIGYSKPQPTEGSLQTTTSPDVPPDPSDPDGLNSPISDSVPVFSTSTPKPDGSDTPSAQQSGSSGSSGKRLYVTTDDVIPLWIALLIKTRCRSLYANIVFLRYFCPLKTLSIQPDFLKERQQTRADPRGSVVSSSEAKDRDPLPPVLVPLPGLTGYALPGGLVSLLEAAAASVQPSGAPIALSDLEQWGRLSDKVKEPVPSYRLVKSSKELRRLQEKGKHDEDGALYVGPDTLPWVPSETPLVLPVMDDAISSERESELDFILTTVEAALRVLNAGALDNMPK